MAVTCSVVTLCPLCGETEVLTVPAEGYLAI